MPTKNLYRIVLGLVGVICIIVLAAIIVNRSNTPAIPTNIPTATVAPPTATISPTPTPREGWFGWRVEPPHFTEEYVQEGSFQVSPADVVFIHGDNGELWLSYSQLIVWPEGLDVKMIDAAIANGNDLLFTVAIINHASGQDRFVVMVDEVIP